MMDKNFPALPDAAESVSLILKPEDSQGWSPEPFDDEPTDGVDPDFYGIDSDEKTVADESPASSLVDMQTPETAAFQDARWRRALVVAMPGTRGLQCQTIKVEAGTRVRILRENKYRRSVAILNPPSPVGDGAAVVWLSDTQANARAYGGFPLIAGAGIDGEIATEVWAFAATDAYVSVFAPIYVESMQ